MILRAGFELNEEGFFLAYLIHFFLVLEVGNAEDLVVSGTNDVVTNIDFLSTPAGLRFSSVGVSASSSFFE